MGKTCIKCDKRCYGDYCFQHKPRKPIQNRTPLKPATKRIRQQSDKELEYQKFKEEVLRPALIARDGNFCSCCHRPAYEGEKLDIEHTLNKGSHPDLKRDLKNLTLMCRYPCHDNKTHKRQCNHGFKVVL